jgi:hypothetical protein
MAGLPPTKVALHARLVQLRSRLQALEGAFHDEALGKNCRSELRDLRHISLLIAHLHASGSLRVLRAMLDARAERVARLEGFLDPQGTSSNAT